LTAFRTRRRLGSPSRAAYRDQYPHDRDQDPYQLDNLIGRSPARDALAATLVRRMRKAGEPEPVITRAGS
jgi:hypothetical protein